MTKIFQSSPSYRENKTITSAPQQYKSTIHTPVNPSSYRQSAPQQYKSTIHTPVNPSSYRQSAHQQHKKHPYDKYPQSYEAARDFDDYPYSQHELFLMLFGFWLYVQEKVHDYSHRYYWRATQKIGNVWHHVHICPGDTFSLPTNLFEIARHKIACYILKNNIWIPDLDENQQPAPNDIQGQIEPIILKQIDRMADISATTSLTLPQFEDYSI